MSCRFIFITSDDYKNRVDISENVSARYVIPYAALAQDANLKPILCKDLYDELETQSIADTLTDDNATLINDYIKPFLVFKTYETYLAYANYKSTPAGIISTKGEDYEKASDAAISFMVNMARQNAKIYENELRSYLKNNTDKYPAWADQCNCQKEADGTFNITSVGGKYNKKDRKYKNKPLQW